MTQVKFGSAGVSAREIDLSGPVSIEPVGVPAGIIGTSLKGPAFVPVTVGIIDDFYAKFGKTDGQKFGPLAVTEWLRNAQAVTYLRVLGVGTGLKRNASGNNPGNVTSAGFVVGEQQPNADTGFLTSNSYANFGGPLGRLYFLGAFMSESAGSTVFSDAGLQGVGSVTPGATSALPIVRGVLMAPSGVILRLSSAFTGSSNAAPGSSTVAVDSTANGLILGTVTLTQNSVTKQDFVLLLNGHKGLDTRYPNVYTASFDPTSPNYFPNVFNTDPSKFQQAGHYLYANWDIHPAMAVVTGTTLVRSQSGAGSAAGAGAEASAFLVTGSNARNVGSTNTPNYENFEDRFRHAVSPWVISQKFGGTPANLFRFHMLDDGAGTANKVKISIENLAPSADAVDKYGSFDVLIRDWNDTDTTVRALEAFRGVNLNPSSDRYLAKVVGDLNVHFDFDRAEIAQKIIVDGNYPNKSNYVRVEVDSSVDSAETDPVSLPVGFRGPAHLITSGTAPLTDYTSGELSAAGLIRRAVQPPVPFRRTVADGTGTRALVNTSYYWGVQFEQIQSPTLPNATPIKNTSVASYTKYFPDFMTTNENVLVGPETLGLADSAALGIVDVDRFCNNQFSLEKLQVVTSSTTLADPQKWSSAVYVRNGSIGTSDANKTRALTVSDFTQTNKKFLKFTFFMNGGFDGTNLIDTEESALSNTAVKADMDDSSRGQTLGPTVKAYLKALDVIKNKTDVDIQLLAVPGLRHPIITNYAIDAVENRFDALYLMDIEEYDTTNTSITGSSQVPSVTNTVSAFVNRALNTSFGAAYYPDEIMTDPTTKTNVIVPPSVVVLGAFAFNDAVGHPWMAPAGFTRGALITTLESRVKLSKDNMDALADSNINPLVAFANSNPPTLQAQGGVVVWGQKTIQSFASALDRVNVRRLLIDIRRNVREVSNTIIFEPNREATLQKFSDAVEPILSKVKKQHGVDRYKVIIDTTTTTQADVLNNTVRGKIFIQPTKTIEFVSLDFVVTNPGQTV